MAYWHEKVKKFAHKLWNLWANLREFKNQWKYDRITIIYDHAIAKYKEYDLHLLFPTYGTLVMIVI